MRDGTQAPNSKEVRLSTPSRTVSGSSPALTTNRFKLGISSAVELSTVNRVVLGSNPRCPANKKTTPSQVAEW